jgi:transcriptional regulator with XRE-family HTH domain
VTTEPGPATRRRQLGRQLRDLRLAAGIRTMDAAAERSGLSRASISRIESAKQAILPRTVRLLCQTYGIGPPVLDRLVDLATESEDRTWLADYADTVPDYFARYAAEEAEASEIRHYAAESVPALLQTPDYCRTVTGTEKHVEFLLARQRCLDRDNPPTLRLILNEAVLRRQVGGPTIMRAQLVHLERLSQRPNITIQVLPFTTGAHPAMAGSFTLLQFPVHNGLPTIFIEFDSGALYPDSPEAIDRYARIFSQLRALALPPTESRALIAELAADM